jgi:hypothetical protein
LAQPLPCQHFGVQGLAGLFQETQAPQLNTFVFKSMVLRRMFCLKIQFTVTLSLCAQVTFSSLRREILDPLPTPAKSSGVPWPLASLTGSLDGVPPMGRKDAYPSHRLRLKEVL